MWTMLTNTVSTAHGSRFLCSSNQTGHTAHRQAGKLFPPIVDLCQMLERLGLLSSARVGEWFGCHLPSLPLQHSGSSNPRLPANGVQRSTQEWRILLSTPERASGPRSWVDMTMLRLVESPGHVQVMLSRARCSWGLGPNDHSPACF